MKEVTISARVPEALSEQINTLAQLLQRNRSWVIKEALRGYIESERQYLEAVEEGIRADDEGRVVPHEMVVKHIHDLIANHPSSK